MVKQEGIRQNKIIQDSQIYIEFRGRGGSLLDSSTEKIDYVFKDLFGSTCKKVVDINSYLDREIIYEVNTPIFRGDDFDRELFSSLEVLFCELGEYKPCFTQLISK